jgi:hypothetical protein
VATGVPSRRRILRASTGGKAGHVLPTPASVLCRGIDAGPFGIIKNHFPSNGSAELWRTPRNYAKSGRKYCADV